jgi:thiamine-phosphate pyrophosphorylase
MRSMMRIIDANANRAREALRVLEDYARFILDDGVLSARLKRLRHGLASQLKGMSSGRLGARDAAGDVGRRPVVKSEYRRAGAADVVEANAARLTEALRSLEEYSKTTSPARARRFENMRFEAYEAAQLLDVAGRRRSKMERLRIYAILSSELIAGPIERRAEALLAAGVDAIQLREKLMDDGPYIRLAARLTRLARRFGGLFFVNDRVHVCEIVDADGVHLGQDDTSVADARKLLAPTRLVGLSTHGPSQVRKAIAVAPDYISAGPVFATPLKPDRKAVGTRLVEQAVRMSKIPVVAIGGVTAENAAEVFAAGAHAVALSRAMCRAEDVKGLVRSLRKAAKKST